MNEFLSQIQSWIDPATLGDLVVRWGACIVAALGVLTTNFLAMLGAAGLATGLALKDSLSIPYPQRDIHIVSQAVGQA